MTQEQKKDILYPLAAVALFGFLCNPLLSILVAALIFIGRRVYNIWYGVYNV